MKILLCADHSSANTISWFSGLKEHGCDVVVASVRAERNEPGIISLGSKKLPARIRFLTSKGQLKNIIAAEKPDLLIGYRITSYGFLASQTGFRPLVLAAQNERITYTPEHNYWREKLLGYFARKSIAKADLIHAWGSNIKEGLLKFGAREEQIFVMHRGIDLKTFFPGQNRKYDKDHPVFISTRSLANEYRIDLLLRAFHLLLREKPQARLKIIGDGTEKIRLAKFAEELGLSGNVSFLGKLNAADVASTLRESDIYVSTIQTEGISSSLLEACASGVFPIAGDIPSSRILVQNGKNGILIPDLTPVQLARAMLSASGDETLLSSARTVNLGKIKDNFDRHGNIMKFIQKYNELLR